MEFPFSRKRLLTPHGSYFLWNVKRKLVMLRWSLLVQTFTSSSSSSHTFFKGEGGGAWSGSRQTGCHKVSQCWEGCSPERPTRTCLTWSAGDGEIWWGFYFSGGISRGAAELIRVVLEEKPQRLQSKDRYMVDFIWIIFNSVASLKHFVQTENPTLMHTAGFFLILYLHCIYVCGAA